MKFHRLSQWCTLVFWGLFTSISAVPDTCPATRMNLCTVKILDTCYADEKTIIVHDETDETVIESLSTLKSISVIRYSDTSMANVAVINQEKANLFMLNANSGEQVHKRLSTLKSSPWWNIMAFFFILDSSMNGCLNALDILKATWKMNVVTGFFLCHDSHQALMVYSYNPFTNRAPHPWKEVKVATKEPDDRWTLFVRRYDEDFKCDGMNFDRTQFLDGYKIRAIAFKVPPVLRSKPKRGKKSHGLISQFDANVMEALEISLNATFDIQVLEVVSDVNDTDLQEEACYNPLRSGSRDFAACLKNDLLEVSNVAKNYPIIVFKLVIITKRRGFYTPVEKICNYYGIVTLVSMIVLLAITFGVVLAYDKKRRIAFSVFEMLRLVINTALHTRMNTHSVRIFFFGIFLYFLIIHATFQGHISAFLTKEEERKNVESLKDLRNPNYTTIYISEDILESFNDSVLLNKMTYVSYAICLEKVKESVSVACITLEYIGTIFATQHDLHCTKVIPGLLLPFSYATRNDFPLKQRIDASLMKITQTNLAEKWIRDISYGLLAKKKGIEERSVELVRPITLDMLSFAFIMWGIGLLLATICFIFERRATGPSSVIKKRQTRFKPQY